MSLKHTLSFSGAVLLLASFGTHSLATTDEYTRSPHASEPLNLPVAEQAALGIQASLEAPSTETQYLWSNGTGFSDRATALINALENVSQDGLNPEYYHLSELQTLRNKPAAELDFDELEARMTTAFTQLIRDLGRGVVDPTVVQKRWFEKPPTVDVDSALSALASQHSDITEIINQYRPSSDAYRHLMDKLQYYRQLERVGGLMPIPKGPSIRPGESDSRVPKIRDYLELTLDIEQQVATGDDDTSRPADRNVLTPALSAAVARFQKRHGLEDDGIVGKKTVAAMNVPVSERVTQIKLNLERLRWFNRTPGDAYLLTNIPAYQLDYRVDEKSVLSMPVVVGKKKYMTPVFSDHLKSIVFNPNWNVPRSIADRELIPRELEDPGYLARNNYELIQVINGNVRVTNPNDVAMATYQRKHFPYTIRQRPGKNNALGKLKFLFPNPYSIYLHDTPAKGLFQRNRRAYSHGCIRLAKPKTLAQTLLNDDSFEDREIDDLYERSNNAWVNLNEPLPNHIVYWTSWVDDDQNVYFAEDIYGHDAPLLDAMENALLPAEATVNQFAESQHPVMVIADTGDIE